MFLGAHMSIAGGVHTAFARAEVVGCTALQIFVKNASQWNAKPLAQDEIARFASERRRSGIERLVAHDSYLINLATPDDVLWNRSIDALTEELTRSEALELEGLVTHPGAHMGSGDDAGIARVARAVNVVLSRTRGFRSRLLLETTAGMGSTLGHRFEHLRRMRELVTEPERVGTCLDTCHVFSAGYDLRTPEAVRETLDRFDAVCGIASLGLVHLNDSLKPFESRRDRHAHIGEGEIGRSGFAAILRDSRLREVPMVLETPKGESMREDARNLTVLRALALGAEPPLRPVPRTPQWRAGTLRSSLPLRARTQRIGA
jgi:deoxyribonuclease-4